ncbi:MAG: ABC transporter ATP-binding protein [Opitutaceae bacterium]
MIEISGLSKRYRLGKIGARTLRDELQLFTERWRNRKTADSVRADRPEDFWALRDIEFSVEQGEVLGLIGRNGAGKSTLLKILSRITEPTFGKAVLRGSVGSLLEVGTGFHPELTGMDNIFLNGAILGMDKAEIRRKLDEIIAFSGIERHIETPVKRYSSGMIVRLGFAVAAHLEPDILIVDEVLAVGDAEFQRKCIGKMQDVAGHGRTVIFVSHQMGTIQQLCTRCVSLHQGRVVDSGPTADVVSNYLNSYEEEAGVAFTEENPYRTGSREVRLTDGRIVDSDGRSVTSVVAGADYAFEFDYVTDNDDLPFTCLVKVHNQRGIDIVHFSTQFEGVRMRTAGGEGRVRCAVQRLPLPLGKYRVEVVIEAFGRATDSIPNAFYFMVDSSVFFSSGRTPRDSQCAVLVDHDWSHDARTSKPQISK